ncbi:hypothetical protein N7533_011579 [Penicillium manginii]|uniref:uncharacterized protein n=1 Tax=Penicillium manginii TaxID=203109 RepID=UPI0025465F62|nr:uncharacterized protein N7533_011579 [Penicillium manginii]KAJ5742170.1 hypothetical protein N7533_011579 [Penicillium manginii]
MADWTRALRLLLFTIADWENANTSQWKLTLKLREASTKKIKESLRKQRADLDAQEDALEARLAEAAKDMAALKLEENGTYKTKGT